MCVFLTLRLDKAQVKKQYNAVDVDDLFFGPNYVQSAFSFSKWPVISSEKPDYVSMMSWGLIPHWVKDENTANKLRASTVNARVVRNLPPRILHKSAVNKTGLNN